MFSRLLKAVIKNALDALGLRVWRRRTRGSITGLLRQAKDTGLSPRTVIDVGAAYGEFTLQCSKVFPEARYILLEPLEEFKPFLESVTKSVLGGEYILAAAAAESGEVAINVHADLVGTSSYFEGENSNVNGVPRIVQAIALDCLVRDRAAEAPILLKIDVQGAELNVLLGAEEILRDIEYILLEVSCFEFFKGGPQFFDVVTFMKSRGFVAYDICGLQYRPLDNALSQIDIAFVKEMGLFRRHHYYATPTQREEQNKRFEHRMREVSKRYRLK